MARPCNIGFVKDFPLQEVDEVSPGSSSLVCQALVEEEEGWLPSPPATSKIEIAHKMVCVGPLAEVQVQVQEEGEEGSQYESRRLSIPTCSRIASVKLSFKTQDHTFPLALL